MGTIQILTKYRCCSETDLEVDNDDDEKPPMVKANQKPTITRDGKDDLINVETDSFATTMPCFSK